MTGSRWKRRKAEGERPSCIGAGARAVTSCTYRQETYGDGELPLGIEPCLAGAPGRGPCRKADSGQGFAREAERQRAESTRYGAACWRDAPSRGPSATRTTAGAGLLYAHDGQTTSMHSCQTWGTVRQATRLSELTMTGRTLRKTAGGLPAWNKAQTVGSVVY